MIEVNALVKQILLFVESENGKLTWYQIVKSIDQSRESFVPSTFSVLNELIRDKLVTVDPIPLANESKFSITEEGKKVVREMRPSSNID